MRASHVVAVIVGIVALAAGCSGPKHMSRAHGRAYRAYLERQSANPAALEEAEKGLDSQEATIVADAYRRSLAPKGTRDTDQGDVLLIAPPPRGRSGTIAPSVPKD